MKILLPERRSFKREMEAIGWTNQQIETFLNKVARPAYVVPERLARSAGFFTRGALFRADHTRMVIMCERLGLIPQGMDVKDFARQLQHGKSVNYPQD